MSTTTWYVSTPQKAPAGPVPYAAGSVLYAISGRQARANRPCQKLEKTVPDQPKTSTPVHLRTRQVLADFPVISSQGPFVPPKEGKEASS